MFIREDNGKYRLVEGDPTMVIPKLDPGMYSLEVIKHVSIFGERKDIFVQPNDVYRQGRMTNTGIYKVVTDFVNSYFSETGKEVRKAMRLNNRCGMFFKGSQGTGKTYLAGMIAEKLVKDENAICLMSSKFSDIDFPELVDAIRKNNDPDRLIVFILDEFEKDYKNCDEKKLLGFLDGTNSRDNLLVIATANEIHQLPSTLLERPGRFELVVDFRIDSPEVLTTIIESMIPKEYSEKVSVAEIMAMIIGLGEVTIDKIKSITRDYLVSKITNGNDNKSFISQLNSNIVYNKEEKLGKRISYVIPANVKVRSEDLEYVVNGLYTSDNESITIDRLLERLGIRYKIDEPKKIEMKKEELSSPEAVKEAVEIMSENMSGIEDEILEGPGPSESEVETTVLTEEELEKELGF